MSIARIGVLAVSLSGVLLSVAVYIFHRDLDEQARDDSPGFHVSGKPTLGDDRFAELQKFTRAYVARHADAPAAMKRGSALAPIDFLNAELEARQEKWRVRTVSGLIAETFDVT